MAVDYVRSHMARIYPIAICRYGGNLGSTILCCKRHVQVMSIIASAAIFGNAYELILIMLRSFTKADFFGVRSWFPCLLYSGSILFGSIGRQLAIVPDDYYGTHRKAE